jgi:hypothetical protein
MRRFQPQTHSFLSRHFRHFAQKKAKPEITPITVARLPSIGAAVTTSGSSATPSQTPTAKKPSGSANAAPAADKPARMPVVSKALSLPPSKTELPAASCHFLIRSKYEHYIKMVPPY